MKKLGLCFFLGHALIMSGLKAANTGWDDNQRFRTIFASLGGEEYSLRDLSKALLLLPEDLPESPGPGDSQASQFTSQEHILRGLNFADLHLASQQAGFFIDPGISSDFSDFREDTLTIVMLPGFLSEFIEAGVFAQFFSKESSLARYWQENLSKAGAPLRQDMAFSLAEAEEIPTDLSLLAEAASIDHPVTGRPLINFYSLRAPFGSLETMGSLSQRAETYLRRIRKIFQLMGKPGRYFILGYSLGGNTGLEMMADCTRPCQGREPGLSQDKDLAGFIGLAAPLWGSVLADLSQKPGEPLQIMLNALKTIGEKLSSTRSLSFWQIPGAMLADALILRRELSAMMVLLENQEGSGPSLPHRDPGTDKPHVPSLLSMFGKIMQRLFPPGNFLTDYISIIRRFKILSQSFRMAVSELETGARNQWWASHYLSPDRFYLSLTGVMDSGDDSPFSFMGPNTMDFSVLRESARYLSQETGISLNDSQVTLHHGMLWPAIHRSLNPGQPEYRVINLGILGSHHWGLAFPVAFQGRSGEVNPYPRELLLRSVARFASELADGAGRKNTARKGGM